MRQYEERQEMIKKLEKESAEKLDKMQEDHDASLQLLLQIKDYFKSKLGSEIDASRPLEDQLGKLFESAATTKACEECKKKEMQIAELQQRLDHTSKLNKEAIRQQLELMRTKMSEGRSIRQDSRRGSVASVVSVTSQTEMKELPKSKVDDKKEKKEKGAGTSNRATNDSGLGANHKILLNNYVRQVKVYLSNCGEDGKAMDKMRERLDQIAAAQQITLFDEEDDDENSNDESKITPELIQQVVDVSLDMTYELLVNLLPSLTSETTTVYRTIELGLTKQALKEMQSEAKNERK